MAPPSEAVAYLQQLSDIRGALLDDVRNAHANGNLTTVAYLAVALNELDAVAERQEQLWAFATAGFGWTA